MLSELSLEQCHDRLLAMMRYDDLRGEQAECRRRGVYRGIGLAAFIVQTAVGPGLYGPQQVRVSANETCRSDARAGWLGPLRDQHHRPGAGDPHRPRAGHRGGARRRPRHDRDRERRYGYRADRRGAWASRGTALGGEAALRAARRLRQGVLTIAATLLQAETAALRLVSGEILNAAGLAQMKLADIAATAVFRPHTIPLGEVPPLDVTETFTPRDVPYISQANGVQAAHVEVDVELGTTRVLGFWVVDDCGRVIIPMLVDEQMRGGVVQGIGSALYEECIYGETGQLENGSLVDYLVPMASEMPDIMVAHIETPTSATTLGARGVGEAGAVGAAAAIWTAVNDALSPLGVAVTRQPITPEHVLDQVAKRG